MGILRLLFASVLYLTRFIDAPRNIDEHIPRVSSSAPVPDRGEVVRARECAAFCRRRVVARDRAAAIAVN